jgi:hypothetical protein
MNAMSKTRTYVAITALIFALVIAAAIVSCESVKRTGTVGLGAALLAALGLLASPLVSVVGAFIGAILAFGIVEGARADGLEQARTAVLHSSPWHLPTIPWWIWLFALWLFLKWARILDWIKKRRWDEFLRMVGLRTHRRPPPGA